MRRRLFHAVLPHAGAGCPGNIGVPLWQEDLWKEIIRAADSDHPDETRFMEMPGFNAPAASQYAATTPELLRWFDGYNERQPNGRRIFPFGFLLFLQAKSRMEMAKDEPSALSDELWRRRERNPAAPYYKKPSECVDGPSEARTILSGCDGGRMRSCVRPVGARRL